jgi:thioredoxin reductase (NADPH)
MYDVIIIGSGPSGLTAAIYTTRANLKTLVIGGEQWGGQPMLTTEVDNFPGFPEGIQGPDLMANIRKQAERFGAEIINENYTGGDLSKAPFKLIAGDKTYESKAVIIATGAKPKMLGIPGEKEKLGRGVSICAICDAGFFRNKKVAVIGGGDVAMEEAIELAEFASEVVIVHRRDEFRASKSMQENALKNPKIKTMTSVDVLEILGQEKVTGIKIKEQKTGEIKEVLFDGVFLAIGYEPSSEAFKELEKDERGYLLSEGVKTKIPGLFTSGDVMDRRYRQSITAAAFGAMAALEVERYLMGMN